MLRSKSLLDNFDLVEDIDEQSATLYKGGILFPLYCRGSAGSPSITINGGEAKFNFKWGNQAARLGVTPGTCAWGDRGGGPGERSSLCFSPSMPGGVEFIENLRNPDITTPIKIASPCPPRPDCLVAEKFNSIEQTPERCP